MHDGPLAQLRTVPDNPHGFRGYGPLLALGVLLLLMVLLAPTIAPEHVILEPSDEAPSSTATTTATTAPTTVTTAVEVTP